MVRNGSSSNVSGRGTPSGFFCVSRSATSPETVDWPCVRERTVNRMVRAVTAGLNRAHRLGHIGNPAAWRLETLPDDDESETAVFLSPAQRKGLIAWPPRQQQPFCVALKFPE